MSTRLRDKEEKLLQILQKLAQESMKGTLIVVEGKKDIETLRALGIDGRIISAKTGGKSMLDVVSEVENSSTQKAILLLDFDRRGKEWTHRLKQKLEHAGMTPDLRYWLELLAFVGRDVKDVEGLVSYMETLKSKIRNS